jgi:cytochrome P450
VLVGLEGYIEELIATRRRSLTDDLISELIRAEDNGDKLSHDEIVKLAVILLNAGTDSTRNQLAAAVQTLADHPTSRSAWPPTPNWHRTQSRS